MNFEKKYNVVVVGGGIAGVAAALSSARRGIKTALIEKTVYLGGLATTGVICDYLPLCDGNGTQVTLGLAEELLKASVKYGPGKIAENWKKQKSAKLHDRYMVRFNPSSFIFAIDELLEEAGVDIWFDTLVCKTVVDDNSITGIEVENKSGRGILHAKCFIDATGDADLAYFAGCKCVTEENYLAIWAQEYQKGTNVFGPGICMHSDGGWDDDTKGFNGINGNKVSRFIKLSRKKYRENIIKQYKSGKFDRNSLFPLFLPAMAQYRKSRRINGRFTLSDDMDWTTFEDSIGMVADWRTPGVVWEVPYRSLLPSKFNNLLAAGRCISSDKDAWEVTRVIPAAALTGEVAGIVAAMKTEKDINLDKLELKDIQKELKNKYGFPLHFLDVGLTPKTIL